MQTNPAVEQSEIVRWSESPCNKSGRNGKGLQRKGCERIFGVFRAQDRVWCMAGLQMWFSSPRWGH